MSEYARRMKWRINELIAQDGGLKALVCDFERYFNVILFGGTVRDILFDKSCEARDIDIVLYPRDYDLYQQDNYLDRIIRKSGMEYIRNRFGGYKINTTCNRLDVWLLKNTWAFRERIMPGSVENLLNSVYLNIDAYAWDCSRDLFVAQCDKRTYREIDIVLEKSDCESLNLIRAIVLSGKYGMPLSKRITMKLVKVSGEWDQLEMNQVQLAHYGKIMIKKQDIYNVLRLYCVEENR